MGRNSLSLHCQYHPEIITSVSTGEEIAEIIKKGCNKVCGSHIFRCGHTCKYGCHTADREHIGVYKCPSHPERTGDFSIVIRAVGSVASAVVSVASGVVSGISW
ncbi:hypothetical protein J6590_082334 [Homalodisca vitripennis]|nr:hypothetical protein J6590_082334 [Homalodisca vitripennis]